MVENLVVTKIFWFLLLSKAKKLILVMRQILFFQNQSHTRKLGFKKGKSMKRDG